MPTRSPCCALVPPPRFHMIRYYGLFASRHRLRARVIPSSPKPRARKGVDALDFDPNRVRVDRMLGRLPKGGGR